MVSVFCLRKKNRYLNLLNFSVLTLKEKVKKASKLEEVNGNMVEHKDFLGLHGTYRFLEHGRGRALSNILGPINVPDKQNWLICSNT